MSTDERPKNVPDDAIALTVWAGQPAGDPPTALLYGHDGIIGRVTVEYLEQNYGVTFPEPEPEPEPTTVKVEIELTAAEVEALQASRFMWWRSKFTDRIAAALKPAEVNCIECGRPLRLNDDGTLWRDEFCRPWHRESLHHAAKSDWWNHFYCTAVDNDIRLASAPEGVR